MLYLFFLTILDFFLCLLYNRRKRNNEHKLNPTRKRRKIWRRDSMTNAAKEAQRQYKAEWRRKNPEKVKAQQERYWEKRAAQQAQETPPAQDVGEKHDI